LICGYHWFMSDTHGGKFKKTLAHSRIGTKQGILLPREHIKRISLLTINC